MTPTADQLWQFAEEAMRRPLLPSEIEKQTLMDLAHLDARGVAERERYGCQQQSVRARGSVKHAPQSEFSRTSSLLKLTGLGCGFQSALSPPCMARR
jgi:hypothetical protein